MGQQGATQKQLRLRVDLWSLGELKAEPLSSQGLQLAFAEAFGILRSTDTVGWHPVFEPIVHHTSYLVRCSHPRLAGAIRLQERFQGITMNWLRVFRRAETSRMGQGGRQQRHTQAVPSEKCGGLHGRAGARTRVRAACL